MDTRDFLPILKEVSHPDISDELRLPLVDWYNEDKSKYMKASQAISPKTNKPYIDKYDNFLIDEHGNFLWNEDFVFVNTHEIKKVGEVFERTGKYLDLEKDDPAYNRWVDREEHRRFNGIDLNIKLLKSDVDAYNAADRKDRRKLLKSVHITGEQYNFINYGRIMITDESSIKVGSATARKVLGLPRFFYSQYWWTQAKEFARLNGFNHIVLKSRRAGWSFQEAIDSANDVNLIPEITEIFAAYAKDYLIKGRSIAPMAQVQLDFYEQHTPFNRCGIREDGSAAGLLKKDLENMQLGYKDKGGTAHGYLSKLISVGFGPNNPDAAIGKDALKIKIEEMSNAPNFSEFMNVTEPTTKAGNFKVGMIIGFGTGGSTEGDWKAFKGWYTYPAKYDAMPFSDVWNKNARHKGVGYFKPYVQNLEGFDTRGISGIDQYGNPNYVSSTNIYLAERAAKKADVETSQRDYLVYCGQYANSSSESFAVSQDNIFVTPALTAHVARVESGEIGNFYRDGMVMRNKKGIAEFKTLARINADGGTSHHFLNDRIFRSGDDVHGCIREWYPPYIDENGKIPNDLYRIYFDPVAKDKDVKTIKSKSSLNSFCIKMMPNNLIPGNGDMIIAEYTGRFNLNDDTFRFILDVCDAYNAKLLPETDRDGIVDKFKAWRRTDRLVKTPIHVHDTKIKVSPTNSYGISIGSNPMLKGESMEWFRQWLYTPRGVDDEGAQLYNYNFIYTLPGLQEIVSWNPDDNFDRLSTYLIMSIDVQDYINSKKHIKHNKKSKSNSIFRRNWF